MQFAKKLSIVLLSSQVCLSLCQFQSNALIFGVWILFLDFQVVKATILFIPILSSLLNLCG